MPLVPNNTLITATPEEGRELAIMLARKTIGAIQTDADVSGYRDPRLEFGRDSATWWVTWYFFYAGLCGVGVTCLWWLLEQVRSRLRSRLARRS